MPNKKGGKKYKKHKSKTLTSRQLILKETDDEEYGQVIKVKGNGRFDVMCCDGLTRIGILRGKLRKRQWIHNMDMVLVSLWEFEDDKCSIIHSYEVSEINKLKELKQIPSNFKIKNDEEFDDSKGTFNDYPQTSSSSDTESDDDDIDIDEL
jgi:translation initiation factor 1A